jgi:Ser/Thr protein kinase RdoA (MazF antagonist)
MEYSRFVEKLKDFDEYNSKAQMALAELINYGVKEDQHFDDLLHADCCYDFITLQSWMTKNNEYIEIKLLFIAGYHDDALLSRLEKLLFNLENARNEDTWVKRYEKGHLTEGEFEFLIGNERTMKENILIMIQKIKEKLEKD